MTDRKQFEAMLEALINEDQETAKEIFHNIVVAKSREIYEELLSEDFDLEEKKEEDDKDAVEEGGENPFADSEEEGDEEGDDEEEGDDVGGDATDDFVSDISDEEGDEEGEEGDEEGSDVEDRVMDLEDALDELKAEFEQLMAGEEGEEHMGGDDMGMEPEMDADMGGMTDMDAEPKEMDELQQFMEYVDKVGLPKHGDNGANAKSVVAGKNDMGGTVANIAKGGESKGAGTKGGLLNPSTKEENFGNVNVPGGNAGKTAFKKKEPGHGAEKKGAGDTAPDKKSIIGSRK